MSNLRDAKRSPRAIKVSSNFVNVAQREIISKGHSNILLAASNRKTASGI